MSPEMRISELDYMSLEEKEELLAGFNTTEVIYPEEKTIVDLFEEQVLRTPESIALVYEGIELSYGELNARSNQLAHYLRSEYGVRGDDLIGIRLERSEWMVISILGVLKSGGGCVPVDPEYPSDRIAYMLSDSNCKAMIDEEELALPGKMELKYTGFIGLDTTKHYVIIEAPKYSKADLYKRTLTYLNSLYPNPQRVISVVNGESITINANTDAIKAATKPVFYPMSYTITMEFKDGKIKFQPSINNMREHGTGFLKVFLFTCQTRIPATLMNLSVFG
jgi:acyl-CoA synthetase (AMP-forming)/AMP-acid ligase II